MKPVRIIFALTALLVLSCSGITPVFGQDISSRIVYRIPGMDSVNAERDIVYRRDGGVDLTMDVYTPRRIAPGQALPAIIFIHGGFLPRSMKPLPKEWGVFRSYGQLAAASGMIGVSFNHRYYGWDRAALDTSFGDVSAAIRFFRSNASRFHLDPDRLCLWAFSGGGPHLCVPFRDSIGGIRCLVSYYAILDIRSGAVRMGIDTAGGWMDACTLSRYLSFMASSFPPLLIARAGLDNPGLNASIDEFLASAFRTNESVELLTHPEGVHGFDILNDDDRSREIIARTIEFVRTNLFGPARHSARGGPSAGKLYAMMLDGHMEEAKGLISSGDSSLRSDPAIARIISEVSLGSVGYWLLSRRDLQAAIDAFRWDVELYPRSPVAIDGLGDAYAAAGKNQLALENARKALRLLESSPGLSESTRKRIEQSALAKVKRFQ